MTSFMRGRVRSTAGAGLALGLALGGTLLCGGVAHAQDVASGTLSFSGDAGDYISGGASYSYATGADQFQVSSDATDQYVDVEVTAADGTPWTLDLAAPAGQALAVGTYTGATRFPFNSGSEPGLSLFGDGRGCNTVTGSFTVSKVDFGPNGYVQDLDATYEQHCEGGTSALTGQVHIVNPPPPAVLTLGLAVAVDGTASALNGQASVHGTVTCNKPTQVTVAGQVTQVKKRVLIRGSYTASVACTPAAPAAWQASADPTATTPFQKGDVQVTAQADATDPDYGSDVTAAQTTTVQLTKTKTG